MSQRTTILGQIDPATTKPIPLDKEHSRWYLPLRVLEVTRSLIVSFASEPIQLPSLADQQGFYFWIVDLRLRLQPHALLHQDR